MSIGAQLIILVVVTVLVWGFYGYDIWRNGDR